MLGWILKKGTLYGCIKVTFAAEKNIRKSWHRRKNTLKMNICVTHGSSTGDILITLEIQRFCFSCPVLYSKFMKI